MTTDREDLIEEAAATIAVAELVRTRRTWGDLLEPQKDEYRRVARAALSVFEQAHTPTDDERDAEANRIWPIDRDYSPAQVRAVFSAKELDAYCVSAFTRGVKFAAGFRRTVTPEPSAEPLRDDEGDMISSGEHRKIDMDGRGFLVCDTCTNVLGLNVRWDHAIKRPEHVTPEPQREPSALPEVDADPDTAFELGRVSGYDEAMREVAQREPSDAMVRAGAYVLDEGAMDAPQDYPLAYEEAMSTARNVLNAAFSVGQEEGR